MKRFFASLLLLALLYGLPACSNKKKEDSKTENKVSDDASDDKTVSPETAAAVAAQWCDLNGRVTKASEADKEAAKAALKEFEQEMESKYKNNEAFMKEIEKEAEKCEDASEGK